jgi:hypothetical protein
MKLAEVKQEIQKYQHLEDTGMIDFSIAIVIATRLKLGDPVWGVLISASSGGKSQILRPISLSDTKFIHRIDDVTENTFLSGMKQGKDSEKSNSLLVRMGHLGMMAISDLTVLFSKSSESRQTILSQFRMIYDGEMTKFSGTSTEPITWKGHLGVIAGCTPSLYGFFEEVSDMGERFIYYRMKEYDPRVATRLALGRKTFGKELDDILSSLYGEYIKNVVVHATKEGLEGEISPEVEDRIIDIASFAERARTPVHTDFRGERIMKIPVAAMPMRVALQLKTIAKSLSLMSHFETGSFDLSPEQMEVIEWCGYSLANEEKRACLRVLAQISFGENLPNSIIAEKIGLSDFTTSLILQNLSATGIVVRTKTGSGGEEPGNTAGIAWGIKNRHDYELICRVEKISKTEETVEIPWE